MTKDRLINLALLLASLIVTVLLTEVGLRVFGVEPPGAYTTYLGREKVRKPFPGVRYLYPAHVDFTQEWPSDPRGYFDSGTYSLTYRVNNYGFRSAEFTIARNDNVRVAFLGDSFCWGLGVRQADLFATLIERQLNQRRPLGVGYEVYNFCLPGYSTVEEAALYDHVVRYFRPDVLVVWYFLNDVNAPPHLYVHRARREDRRSRLRFFDLMRAPWRRMAVRRALAESIDQAYEPGHPGLKGVDEGLRRIRRVSGEAGVVDVLAVFPWLYRLDGESYPFGKAHRAVASRAAREGFEVLDLLPVFDGSRDRDLWVHPRDNHPNEIAHAMVARAMSGLLESRLVEEGERLLAAAGSRRQLPLPPSLEATPARDWYRPFVVLGGGTE